MKKLNNKGFSLIDLLIAIAVMALLLGPIIAQTLQTVNVSAEAKEKQYVVESVEDTVEYFRGLDLSSLDHVGMTQTDTYLGGDIEVIFDGDITCTLCDASGNALQTPAGGDVTVTYHQTNYSIPDVSLGREQTAYTRVVTKNDLTNQIVAKGYQVDYDSFDYGGTAPEDFVINSDNTTGIIDDSNLAYTKLVCRENPNGSLEALAMTNMINMQYIDASSLAIITSEATTLDYQVESDISALLVQYAASTENNPLSSLADDAKGLNDYINALIDNPYSIDKSRMINVKITAHEDLTDPSNPKPDYYNVECTVEYKISFVGSANVIKPFTDTSGDPSSEGTFTYSALNRNYYVKQPVNVYMIYEPLLLTTNSSSYAYYADKDYITITTDKYTSGSVTGYNPSTVYLISSTTNWAEATGATTSTYALYNTTTDGDGNEVQSVVWDYNMYRTYFNNSYRNVDININQVKTGADFDAQTPIDIYTNIGVRTDENGYATKTKNNKINEQFSVTSDTFDSSFGTYFDYDSDKILPWYTEDNYDSSANGIAQLNVFYTNPNTSEVTYINGTKGAH